MNKKELIKKIEELKTLSVLDATGNGLRPAIFKREVLDLLEQLEEPKKVVVPEIVARNLMLHQGRGFSLASMIDPDGYFPGELKEWMKIPANQETYAKAWLYGYEIEQEKLYTVEIPDPHNDIWKHTILKRLSDGGIRIRGIDDSDWRAKKEHQLTEDEIKKDFGWAWDAGFAKEVADEQN